MKSALTCVLTPSELMCSSAAISRLPAGPGDPPGAANGRHMATWVNGYQMTDWTDDRKPDPNPRKGLRVEPGTISLQAHDKTTNLRFRNLQIGELPAAEKK